MLVVGLACLASMAVPGLAQAAHPVAGAVYAGNSGMCSASNHHDCLFKFRVSDDGQTLRYVKKGEAISSWQCQGGGGEAIFGTGQYDYRIPTATIHADGSFSGTNGSGSRKLRVTGSFTGSGATAAVKFVLPNQHCHTAAITLHEK